MMCVVVNDVEQFAGILKKNLQPIICCTVWNQGALKGTLNQFIEEPLWISQRNFLWMVL